MPSFTKNQLLIGCTTIFLTIILYHRFVIYRPDLPFKAIEWEDSTENHKSLNKHFEGTNFPEETTKQNAQHQNTNSKIFKGTDVPKTTTKYDKPEDYQTLYNKIFKDIINMTFYDDPSNWICHSNKMLFRTTDFKECLSENTIFFLETSDSPYLKPRQACAVESAALLHPEWQVRVLFTSSVPLNLNDSFTKFISTFDNVQLHRMELDFLMQGTPLWYWYKKGKWKSSPHKVVHLSDAIRLSLLWKYGGIYLDTDVVVLRPLSHLRNTVSIDSGTNIGNSFLAFNRSHPLLRFTLIDYATLYNPNGFATNGPVLLNRNFVEHCAPKSIVGTENKCHMNVLPKESVYPIDYDKWQDYFKPQTATLNEMVFNSSYIIHVWNKLSSAGKMIVGQNSWYEAAMRNHCPEVYKLVTDIGYA